MQIAGMLLKYSDVIFKESICSIRNNRPCWFTVQSIYSSFYLQCANGCFGLWQLAWNIMHCQLRLKTIWFNCTVKCKFGLCASFSLIIHVYILYSVLSPCSWYKQVSYRFFGLYHILLCIYRENSQMELFLIPALRGAIHLNLNLEVVKLSKVSEILTTFRCFHLLLISFSMYKDILTRFLVTAHYLIMVSSKWCCQKTIDTWDIFFLQVGTKDF